jgi:hypothetical protein
VKRHFTSSHFNYCTTNTPDIHLNPNNYHWMFLFITYFRSITHRWYQNNIRAHILQSTWLSIIIFRFIQKKRFLTNTIFCTKLQTC